MDRDDGHEERESGRDGDESFARGNCVRRRTVSLDRYKSPDYSSLANKFDHKISTVVMIMM
jgi:hypothetical protein